MKILVACEESQAVCKEFRRLGHEVYSCDIIECSGGHPEWHIQQDVLPLLNGDCTFRTCDGVGHHINGRWDMIIAFPPCTYLTVTGNRWFNVGKYGEKAIQRHKDREEAVKFFMAFANADCPRIAIENPIGHMSSVWRKPDQVIHPYYFAESADDENCERKATCLWLKGLPPLKYEVKFQPRVIHYKNGKGTDSPWHVNTMSLPPVERAKVRSKTFPGVAKAMTQWCEDLREISYWIDSPECDHFCSNCGRGSGTFEMLPECPYCGARMETEWHYPNVDDYEQDTGKKVWGDSP